jgi:hypothetical protein
MPKVSVIFALLITFVFTSANAPTFHLGQDLADAALVDSEEPSGARLEHAGNPYLAFNMIEQEFSEDGALERFEIDELFLPKLNVDLPELFDWSAIDSAYYAHSTRHELDTYASAAFRFASLGTELADRNFGGSVGNARIASGNGGENGATQSAGKGPSNESSDAPTTEVLPETPQVLPQTPDDADEADETGGTEQLAKNDEPTNTEPAQDFVPPLIQEPIVDTSVGAQAPVQVPAPGAFGLFVLGLAGMRLAGREKNGSG